jgi:hypothetical protein
MQTLEKILAMIEEYSAIRLADYEIISLFDAQSEFHIPAVVNALGDCLWNAIDIETGELTRDVSYEGGQGMFYDAVLFFTSSARDCTILRLPEVGVAIQFAKRGGAMLADQSEAVPLARYQYDLDWRKDGAALGPWTPFLDEWKALPARYA